MIFVNLNYNYFYFLLIFIKFKYIFFGVLKYFLNFFLGCFKIMLKLIGFGVFLINCFFYETD